MYDSNEAQDDSTLSTDEEAHEWIAPQSIKRHREETVAIADIVESETVVIRKDRHDQLCPFLQSGRKLSL